jgi:hypothetical protein
MRSLLLRDGDVTTPQEDVKLLGITLDSGLNFRSHIKNITSKAERALQQMWRLGGCHHGLTGASFRQLFMTCVLPLMEYGGLV